MGFRINILFRKVRDSTQSGSPKDTSKHSVLTKYYCTMQILLRRIGVIIDTARFTR